MILNYTLRKIQQIGGSKKIRTQTQMQTIFTELEKDPFRKFKIYDFEKNKMITLEENKFYKAKVRNVKTDSPNEYNYRYIATQSYPNAQNLWQILDEAFEYALEDTEDNYNHGLRFYNVKEITKSHFFEWVKKTEKSNILFKKIKNALEKKNLKKCNQEESFKDLEDNYEITLYSYKNNELHLLKNNDKNKNVNYYFKCYN